MELTDRTLAALGYDELLKAISARCRTEPGRARALARPFLSEEVQVRGALQRVEEARALHQEPRALPISGLTEIRPQIDQAARGGMLEPRELIAITHALFAFERASETLEERREKLPSLWELGAQLPVLDRLATRLEKSFEASGEISDRASVELREARERARGLHKAIKSRLDGLLHDEKFSANLREGYYSLRNDRYVVPVLSQMRNEVPGIVHNASQSGQTLFVEPQDLIGIGNDLAIAQSMVLEEERKVLLELSHQVGREGAAITAGIEAVAALDEAEGAALLAEDLKAHTPAIEPGDGALLLKGLRHPRLLLRGVPVIANDVELSGAARAFVVSGPNAGGKTVTLTGVGLCALMLRAGLPIPADPGSRLPLFSTVHAAIGDAQDLSQGLSSFSAHVTLLRDIALAVHQGALVLIDEIAADTDPREGAAIAIAVLEDLLGRGALVLVTTHLEELKALAHLDARFLNGRVGFDARKMAPTYRLQLGAAGASSAIDIARRVGLAEPICVRATELAQNAGGALSKALAANEAERRLLTEKLDEAKAAAAAAQALRERLEIELALVERKRKDDEVKFREALKGELEFARTQVRELLAKLTAEKSVRTTEKASAELTARLNEQVLAERQARAAQAGAPLPSGPAELKVGARVHHLGLSADVEILELDGDSALVAMGAMKLRAKASELTPPHSAARPKPKPPGGASKQQQVDRAEAAAAQVLTLASPTLDLRGQRADEALREIERFLDRASRAGDASVIVIHGHGTGALKASVREHLASSPYAKSARPGEAHEGGDGVTVIFL